MPLFVGRASLTGAVRVAIDHAAMVGGKTLLLSRPMFEDATAAVEGALAAGAAYADARVMVRKQETISVQNQAPPAALQGEVDGASFTVENRGNPGQ